MPARAETLSEDVDLIVVVEVLSFTTMLSVVLNAGVVVLPYPWREGDELGRRALRRGMTYAGYRADVEIAAETDTSQAVPFFADGHFFVQATAPARRLDRQPLADPSAATTCLATSGACVQCNSHKLG